VLQLPLTISLSLSASCRLYYQHNPCHLATCLLTIHGLLHIPDSIVEAGPVWGSWVFPTEYFCGCLLPAIRSWQYPFANLDNYVVASAQLAQIKIKYNLHNALQFGLPYSNELRGSFTIEECKCSIPPFPFGKY
jgi:hypothetical protein